MKILFLDDSLERHVAFKRASMGHDVTHVETARGLIRAMKGEIFDLVYLDHDLGGPESDGKLLGDSEDGRWAARMIADNAEFLAETCFVVHSMNVAAAPQMVATLREAGLRAFQMPFGWAKDPLSIYAPRVGDGGGENS